MFAKTKISTWFQSSRSRLGLDEPTDLRSWREWFVNAIMVFAALVLPLGMVATFPVFIAEKRYGLIALDVGVWLFVIIRLITRGGSYLSRVYLLFAILYTMTITFFVALGPHHARSGWLVMCAVMGAIMFGTRAAAACTATNAAMLMVFYWSMGPENQAWAAEYAAPFGKWAMFVVNISVITLACSLPVGFLLSRLDRSLRQERDAREKLAKEVLERREAQEKLQEGEETLQALLNASTDSAWLVDPREKIVITCNRVAAQRLGKTVGELIGANIFDFLPHDLAESRLEQADKVVRSGKPVRFQDEREGRFYDVTFCPVLHVQGKVDRIAIFAHDFTESKKAEDALRDSEDRYRKLTEQIPAVIYTAALDKPSTTSYVSPQIETLIGFTQAEYGNDPDIWRKQLHPEDRERVLAEVAHAHKTHEPFVSEYRMIARDDSTLWFHDEAVVVHDDTGEPLCLQGVILNITKRKQTEEALWESEEKYRLLIENIPSVTWVTSEHGETTFISPNVEDAYGYTQEEIYQGGDSLWFERIHPDDVELVRKSLERLFTKEQGFDIEYRIQRKDGKWIWLYDTAMIAYEKDDIRYAYGVFSDITERKKAEEVSSQLRQELSRVMRIATLGELAASIAHELNQPLAAILSNAQAAQRFLASEIPDLDDVRDALGGIVEDDRRASEVIRRLRLLLKRGDLERTPVDINEVIREVVALMHRESVIRKISTKLDLAVHLPCVLGDRIQLQQVILNLITNGHEAMKDVEAGSGELVLQTSQDDPDTIIVAIRDSGIGIEPENLQRIFDGFFTTKPEGMGMGLSINRSIVEAHGGRIWATQNPDRGATFYFTLPIYEKGSK